MLTAATQEGQLEKEGTLKKLGARAIVEQLKVAGLINQSNIVIAGNPGEGEELLYMELTNEIQMALAEPVVGSIVDGASRVQSKPAVALVNGFSGFSGLLGDVFNAAQRQSPMLVIVSVSDSQALTGEPHMYTDIVGAAKSARCKCVKNAFDPATLIRDFRVAIIEAMSPPFGPVVFVVGSKITSSVNSEDIVVPAIPNSEIAPPYTEIEKLAERLLTSDSPGILVGDGISRSGAHREVVELAELVGARVWAAMESEVNFPRHHALFEGDIRRMGNSAGKEMLKEVDYLLTVGTPVHQQMLNPKDFLGKPELEVATITYCLSSAMRGHADISFPIIGSPKKTLSLLSQAIKVKMHPEKAIAVKEKRRKCKAKRMIQSQQQIEAISTPKVTIAKFAYHLEFRLAALERRPVIFTESVDGSRELTNFVKNVNMPRMYFDTSGGSLGEWAGAVGAAMLGKSTLVFIGDGSFHYAPQVLWNAVQKKLPIGFVVINDIQNRVSHANINSTLKQLTIDSRSVQDSGYYDLPSVDYVRIAEGYGVSGMKVEHASQFNDAIEQLIDFRRPFLVDLVLNEK